LKEINVIPVINETILPRRRNTPTNARGNLCRRI